MADEDYSLENELDVRILESKTHSELCSVQTYCLNGGTCYRLPSLGMHYCECTDNYEGKRCRMKKMPLDIEPAKMDTADFNWELVKPLIIVGAGVIFCAMVLICVYFLVSYSYRKFSDRKGKYRLAQKSASHDALVIEVEENLVDGDVTQRTRKASTRSRTRLAACSSTPEQAKPFQVQTTPKASATEALQKLMALSDAAEQGQGEFFVDSARNPKEDENKASTTANTVSQIDQPINFYSASDDGVAATRNVASLIHEADEKLVRRPNCQSPSDSNNNEDIEACNNFSVSKQHPLLEQRGLAGPNRRPTDFGQQKIPPFDENLQRYNGVSVYRTNKENDVLYDSDPDATAL